MGTYQSISYKVVSYRTQRIFSSDQVFVDTHDIQNEDHNIVFPRHLLLHPKKG